MNNKLFETFHIRVFKCIFSNYCCNLLFHRVNLFTFVNIFEQFVFVITKTLPSNSVNEREISSKASFITNKYVQIHSENYIRQSGKFILKHVLTDQYRHVKMEIFKSIVYNYSSIGFSSNWVILIIVNQGHFKIFFQKEIFIKLPRKIRIFKISLFSPNYIEYWFNLCIISCWKVWYLLLHQIHFHYVRHRQNYPIMSWCSLVCQKPLSSPDAICSSIKRSFPCSQMVMNRIKKLAYWQRIFYFWGGTTKITQFSSIANVHNFGCYFIA